MHKAIVNLVIIGQMDCIITGSPLEGTGNISRRAEERLGKELCDRNPILEHEAN